MPKPRTDGKKVRPVNPEDLYKMLSPEQIDEFINVRLAVNREEHRAAQLKWTETEIAYRNSVILDLVGQGLSRRRIIEEICDRWNIAQSTAYRWYDMALDALTADNDEFVSKVRDFQLERLNNIAEHAHVEKDYGTMLKCLDQINKICGLYIDKKEVVVKDKLKFDFGTED